MHKGRLISLYIVTSSEFDEGLVSIKTYHFARKLFLQPMIKENGKNFT